MTDHAAAKLFLKPIYVDDAPATGLNKAFSLPPDRDDCVAFLSRSCCARMTEAAAQFGMSITDPSFSERLGKALIKQKPQLLRKSSGEWPHVIQTALLETIRPFGSKKAGRPRHADEILAQLYADVQFLKQKLKLSIRCICLRLSKKMKAYKERYGCYSAGALRKMYQQAAKLNDSDWKFRFFLSGPEVLKVASQIDPVAAAIERHALKT